MLATCGIIPCPLLTASEYFIYTCTYLHYLDFYKNVVILLCTRTCWPHAVSHVRCTTQVNGILTFSFTNIRMVMLATCRIPCPLRTAWPDICKKSVCYFII